MSQNHKDYGSACVKPGDVPDKLRYSLLMSANELKKCSPKIAGLSGPTMTVYLYTISHHLHVHYQHTGWDLLLSVGVLSQFQYDHT